MKAIGGSAVENKVQANQFQITYSDVSLEPSVIILPLLINKEEKDKREKENINWLLQTSSKNRLRWI